MLFTVLVTLSRVSPKAAEFAPLSIYAAVFSRVLLFSMVLSLVRRGSRPFC